MAGRELSDLLIVRERDVGLFSTCLQVLQTVQLLIDESIDRVPIVLLGRGSVYFHEDGFADRLNVWEYYFNPLVGGFGEARVLELLGDRAWELLESQRKAIELERGRRDFPDGLHHVPPLDDRDRDNLSKLDRLTSGSNWAWTDSFYPVVDGRGPITSLSQERGAELVRQFIRPRSHITERADAFHEQHLAGRHVIGVHVRGTDGHSAPARGVEIPFDRYLEEILRRFDLVGRNRCRVVLATDEEAIVDRFVAELGSSVVYCDTHRMVDGDEVFGTGPTGQAVPGYIAKDSWTAVRNGDEAVLEYELLTRSDLLIHNQSSLSTMARYSVTDAVRV